MSLIEDFALAIRELAAKLHNGTATQADLGPLSDVHARLAAVDNTPAVEPEPQPVDESGVPVPVPEDVEPDVDAPATPPVTVSGNLTSSPEAPASA